MAHLSRVAALEEDDASSAVASREEVARLVKGDGREDVIFREIALLRVLLAKALRERGWGWGW
jgi:hypothetical protein